jgi:hypothetical protein
MNEVKRITERQPENIQTKSNPDENIQICYVCKINIFSLQTVSKII